MGTSKCKQGQGDCNSDEDCEGDLRCGATGRSCGAGFKDNVSCCVAPVCDYSMKDNDDCCGHIKCEEGEGHCKNDRRPMCWRSGLWQRQLSCSILQSSRLLHETYYRYYF